MKQNSSKTWITVGMLSLFQFFFAQSITLTVQTADNCMNPLPNAGVYTLNGTLNGKNQYTKGANLRIIWSGSQWEVQGDDPNIGGVSWYTAWANTQNTSTPPTSCWTSLAGCFPISLSGPDAYQVVDVTSSTPTNFNSGTNTVTYTVVFSGTINNLTASNFALNTNGVTGANITGVSQTNSTTWSIQVNVGTGNGTIRLDIANQTGASAIIGCTPTFPIQGGTFNTSNTPINLTAGDIAFTSHNSDGTDSFSFIVLKDGGLSLGTQIFFSDNGWNNVTNSLTETEGIAIWEATSSISQYSQVLISISGTTYTPSTGTMSAVNSSAISLSSAGDQVLAFQGNLASPTFISAIHMNAESTGNLGSLNTWDDFNNGTSSSRSAIPPGLTNGINAIMVVDGTVAPYTEFDNAIYNCTGVPTGTVNDTRLAINNRANWIKDNTTTYNSAPTCTFLNSDGFNLESKIRVYPNPFNFEINIELVEMQIDSKIKIFDNSGRLVFTENLINKLTKINVSNLESGIYFLQIKNQTGEFRTQIIKK